ncbi:MAG: hypothetical protein ABI480_09275 [Chitinophagaceae bacterium]
MKRILLIIICAIFGACNNSSDSKSSGTDTSNSVTLPAGRSSDSINTNAPAGAGAMQDSSTHDTSGTKPR